MSSKTTKQKLPKWFHGEMYEEGATVRNRFSGEEYKLNAVELSMYDFIIGCQLVFEMRIYDHVMTGDFQKGLKWFRRNSPEAYMILLD